MTRTPDLSEVLRAAIDARLQDLHTALPGSVEKFDAATQKVDVKPLLKRTIQLDDDSELTEELPVITDVPVVFPRAGNFFVTFPIAKGDHVLLVFNERSIDSFMEKGDDTDPVDFRTHALADAVAFPGFYPTTSKLNATDTSSMVLGQNGKNVVTIKPDGTISIIPSGAGKVHVGADAAALAIARVTDKTISDVTMTAWMVAVDAMLALVGAQFNAFVGVPVVGVAVVPPVPAVDFGVISTGASKATAE